MLSAGSEVTDVTPSTLATRRWRDRRRRGVYLLRLEVDGEDVQGLIAAGLLSADDESSETISRGVQDLLALRAAGRLKL